MGMRTEKEEIQKLISKMNLSPDSAAALNLFTTEVYTKLKEKKTVDAYSIRNRVAISTYLACDGKACVALPKLRAAAHAIPIKGVRDARRVLKTPRGTAHQKLDSLCHVCHTNDKNVVSRAHDYVSILDNTDSAPTTIAAVALFTANDESLPTPNPILKRTITRATGITAPTLFTLSKEIRRRERESKCDIKGGNNEGSNREL